MKEESVPGKRSPQLQVIEFSVMNLFPFNQGVGALQEYNIPQASFKMGVFSNGGLFSERLDLTIYFNTETS